MIVDTHVHVWEIDPPKYPIGPTAPTWKSYPDEPGTADELYSRNGCTTVSIGVSWCKRAGPHGTTATLRILWSAFRIDSLGMD